MDGKVVPIPVRALQEYEINRSSKRLPAIVVKKSSSSLAAKNSSEGAGVQTNNHTAGNSSECKYKRISEDGTSSEEAVEHIRSGMSERQKHFHEQRHYTKKHMRELILDPGEAEIEGRQGVIGDFVRFSKSWRIFTGSLMVANLVQVGAEVDFRARSSELPWFVVLSSDCFTVAFTMELTVRLYVFGCAFFYRGERQFWNLFDFFIVNLQLFIICYRYVDRSSGIMELSVGSMASFCRLVRFIRVFRMLRVFELNEDLRIIVMTINESFRLFSCTMVLLVSFVFIWGVIFTEVLTQHRKANSLPNNLIERLDHWYGSLMMTCLTLFESIAGGNSWDAVVRPTFQASQIWGWAYCTFVAFSSYAVLNIITSIFVNSSMQYADRVRKEKLSRDMLKTMGRAVDVNADGNVDRKEFAECLEKPEVQEYFRRFNIDVNYGQHLFTVLDQSEDGTVDVVEFISALADLTRPALALETTLILQEVFYISDLLREFDIPRIPFNMRPYHAE